MPSMPELDGAAVRKYREARGLSKARLGEAAGISGQYVGQIESGQRKVSALRAVVGFQDQHQRAVSRSSGSRSESHYADFAVSPRIVRYPKR